VALAGGRGRWRSLDEIWRTELTGARSEGDDLLQKEEGSDGSALAGKMELERKKSDVGAPVAFDRREKRNGGARGGLRLGAWPSGGGGGGSPIDEARS
jgi:hypothetical protein